MDSPLGKLYIARNTAGVCLLDFKVEEDAFVNRIDPLARTITQSWPVFGDDCASLTNTLPGGAHSLTCR